MVNNQKMDSLSQSLLFYGPSALSDLTASAELPIPGTPQLFPKMEKKVRIHRTKPEAYSLKSKVRTQYIAGSRLRITEQTHQERINNKTQEL